MTGIDGCIHDLCHSMGINARMITKIEIFPGHVEVWYRDADYALQFKYFDR